MAMNKINHRAQGGTEIILTNGQDYCYPRDFYIHLEKIIKKQSFLSKKN